MITTDVLGVERVGNAVLTEAAIVATITDSPDKAIVPVKAEPRPIEKEYDYVRARHYALAMLFKIGEHEAVSERPAQRDKSYSETHVKPLTEVRKGKERDIGIDDLIQEGALVFVQSRRGKRVPRSTRASVRTAYYNHIRQAGRKFNKPSKNAYALRIAHGTVKRVVAELGEAIAEDDSLYIPACRKEAQRQVCEYIGMGYKQKTIAKYMGVSQAYIAKLLREIRSEFTPAEFEKTAARNGIPYATTPQKQTEKPFNNHFKPYVRQLRQTDAILVASHRDTRSELPIVPTANAMYASVSRDAKRISLTVISEPFIGVLDTARWIGRDYPQADGTTFTIIGLSH